jgi:hypothetical protein
MAFAAQARNSDNVVIGLWRGAGAIPVPDVGADHYYTAITEAAYLEASSLGLFFGGDGDLPRFIISAGSMVGQADPRPRIAFLEQGTPNIEDTVLRQVGQPDLVLDVAKLVGESGAVVDTSWNTAITLQVSDGRWVRIPFTSGMGTLTVKATTAREWGIFDQGGAKIAGANARLRCRIYAAAEL